MQTCSQIALLASASLALVVSPLFGGTAQADDGPRHNSSRSALSSCRVIAERYRRIADRHPGEAPLQLLSQTPRSGVALSPSLATLENPATELVAWGKKQSPPISIPQSLAEQADAWSWEIERLPQTDFYAVSSIQGTAHCHYSLYFVVRDGQASEATPPPSYDEENGPSCGTGRYYGTVDGHPAAFEEYYDWTPSMTASLAISIWKEGGFSPACELVFNYAPAFREETLNSWEQWEQSDPESRDLTCIGAECPALRRAAYALVAAAQKNPAEAQQHFEGLLSPAQKARYRAALSLPGEGVEASATAEPVEDSNPADLDMESPLRLPYLLGGRLYVASLGHFTIGWRYFADWGVRFYEVKEGQPVRSKTFAIGMTKGRLKSVSISLPSTDREPAIPGME